MGHAEVTGAASTALASSCLPAKKRVKDANPIVKEVLALGLVQKAQSKLAATFKGDVSSLHHLQVLSGTCVL